MKGMIKLNFWDDNFFNGVKNYVKGSFASVQFKPGSEDDWYDAFISAKNVTESGLAINVVIPSAEEQRTVSQIRFFNNKGEQQARRVCNLSQPAHKNLLLKFIITTQEGGNV